MFPNVEVIKADRLIVNRRNRELHTQLRVAPYCRVSTDSEEQAKSYKNQLQYYTNLVNEKKEWSLVGIYADEAISGTRDDKRDDFLRMIQDCKNGLIDMIITKSISRFARNTVDTLRYVRMLKEIGVAVFFEDENINTLTMDGELLLTVLSSVAQQEVENTSSNVKKGLKMKMKRGELVGYNGCLGYDYDPTDKSLTVNENEAKIVKYIFKRYLEGAGAYIIAKELTDLQYKTKRGSTIWQDSSVRGILKNEKYKGDILQGKTFTVDPISKRRLDNFGEEDMFYAKNHHEPIISEEDWNEVQRMMKERGKSRKTYKGLVREKQSRKYPFSSKLECAFCKSNLSRRSWNTSTPHAKTIWHCVTSTKKGKQYCEHSKGIPESIIEGAFMKSFHLLSKNKGEILDEYLTRVQQALDESNTNKQAKQLERKIDTLTKKISKLTDLYLEESISEVDYKNKYSQLTQDLEKLTIEYGDVKDKVVDEEHMKKRVNQLKCLLEQDEEINEFDGQVFDNVIEKVIVGEISERGEINPYKLTFIYRTGISNTVIPESNGKIKKDNKQDNKDCSYQAYEVGNKCSYQANDTR